MIDTDKAWLSGESKDDTSWLPLKRFGYAPGNYINTCRDPNCSSEAWGEKRGTFIGDKRAWRCKQCAETMASSALGEQENIQIPGGAMRHQFYNMTPGDIYTDELGREWELTGFWEGQTVICLESEDGERLTFGTNGLTAERFKRATKEAGE